MGRRTAVLLAIPLQVFVALTAARAMDVGNPTFAPDSTSEARFELRYEQYDRSFDYRNSGDPSPRDVQLGLFGARFSFPTSPRTTAYLELGYYQGRDHETNGLFVGAGGDLYSWRVAGIDTRLLASVSWIPDMNYSGDERAPLSSGGSIPVDKDYSEQWVELSAGVLCSKGFRVGRDLSLSPYLGLVASLVRGDGYVDRTLVLGGERFRGKDTYQIEEDEPYFGVVGLSVFYGSTASFRFEWHLFPGDPPSPDAVEDESLSFVAGYDF